MKKKYLGIILLKSKSQRVKNKNFLKINKKAMFQHVLDNAIDSKIFEKIHLSTETTIKYNYLKKMIKKKKYKKIVDLKPIRPKKLANDKVPMLEVIKNILKYHKNYENICLIYSTGIMINSKDYIKIKNKYSQHLSKNINRGVSLQTMCQYPAPIEWAHKINKKNEIKPIFKKNLKLTSDQFEKTYYDTGGLQFLNKKFLYTKSKRIFGYKLPYEKSIDVDEKNDLEFLIKIKKFFR